jgi:hypothetical protein
MGTSTAMDMSGMTATGTATSAAAAATSTMAMSMGGMGDMGDGDSCKISVCLKFAEVTTPETDPFSFPDALELVYSRHMCVSVSSLTAVNLD